MKGTSSIILKGKGKQIGILTALSIILMSSMSIMKVEAAPLPGNANTNGIIVADGVAIRSIPSLTGIRLGLMYKGEKVKFDPSYCDSNYDGEFTYLERGSEYSNMKGYCDHHFVRAN